MTSSATAQRPDWIAAVPRYVAGQPAPAGGLSLASNESQHGCSPAAVEQLHTLQHLDRYPDPLCTGLREQIADFHEVRVDQVLVGNGSDELVQLLAIACVGHGGRAVAASPGYAMNRITSLLVGASFVGVPLREWRHDLAAMATAEADVTYIVNPHNPTGTTCPRADIEQVARTQRGLTVVDEAYIDFADDAERLTAIPLARKGQVAVLRTFSKAYGLAALRVGYLVGPANLVDRLGRARAPFSVNAAAQLAARAALADRDFFDAHVRANRHNRQAVELACRQIGLQPAPSQANFVFVPTPDEDAMVGSLREAGVAVRAGRTLGTPNAIRITVPNDEGLPRLLQVLSAVRPHSEAARPSDQHLGG